MNMLRTRRVIAVISITAILCITLLGVLVYFQNLMDREDCISEFSWGIAVGDEFLYNASGIPVFEDVVGNFSYLDFSNIHIRVTVVSLPDLSGVSDNETFKNEIVNQNKIECTFENDSTLPEELAVLVSNSISIGILPIGCWEVIDSFFPDAYDTDGDCFDCIFSQPGENHFWIERFSRDMDHDESCELKVNFDNGIPFYCRYYNGHGDACAQLILFLVT